MMYLVLSISLSQAEEAKGYYNETEIQRNSQLFVEASKIAAPQFTQAESNIRGHAEVIQQMEQNLALLNDDLLTTWFTDQQRQMIGYRIQVSNHATMLTNDYDTEFTKAMYQAIENIPFEGSITVCEAQAIHAMMGTAPKCDGTSLSKEIASNMDNNTELRKAITEINAISWPTIDLQTSPQAPSAVTGTQYVVDLHAFSEVFLQERIAGHQQWLESQNDSLIEGLESGDTEAMQKAQANREAYLARLTADGTQLIEALNTYAVKRGKKHDMLNDFALCGNINELGGCKGTDKTQELIDLLKSDRYWAKVQSKSGL